MEQISLLCRQYNVHIIEDASHALGGVYNSARIGSCEYSDISIFSFHPVKIITSAEGGAITTNSPSLYKKLALLRSHGITRTKDDLQRQSEGPWYYEQHLLGFNYRMNELQAALGMSQLSRLDEIIVKRNALYDNYLSLLSSSSYSFLETPCNTASSASD